jgi:hypothetical protein
MGESISPINQRQPNSVGKVEDHDAISAGAAATLADRSPSTEGSTPEHELELPDGEDAEGEHAHEDTKQPAPPQKRKGGRKPVSYPLYESRLLGLTSSRV